MDINEIQVRVDNAVADLLRDIVAKTGLNSDEMDSLTQVRIEKAKKDLAQRIDDWIGLHI